MKKVFGWFSFGKKADSGKNISNEEVISNNMKYMGLFKNIVKDSFCYSSENEREITETFSKGCKYYNDGDNDKALQEFERIDKEIADTREKAIIEFFIGLCYQEKGNLDNAIKFYKNALKYDKNCLEIVNNLGVALLESGNVEEAEKYLKEVVEQEYVTEYEYVNLANAYLELGNYDEAIIYAKKSIEMSTSIVLAYEILTIAYASLGMKSEMNKYYNLCVEFNCEDINIIKELIAQEVA